MEKIRAIETNKSESKVVIGKNAPSKGKEMEKIKVMVDEKEI